MLKKFIILSLVMILLGLSSQFAMAFELVEDQREPTTFGIGYECSLNYLPGVSMAYNFTDNLTAQGIIGIPYTSGIMDQDYLNLSYAGKLFFRFIKNSKNSGYIFGLLGSFTRNASQAFGGVAGLGVELSSPFFPNLVYSGEVGYSIIELPDISNIVLNYGLRIYF